MSFSTTEDIVKYLDDIVNPLDSKHLNDQEIILKDYIKFLSTHEIKNQKNLSSIRAIIFYLHRLTKNLPLKSPDNFKQYLFARKSRGKFYEHLCKLLNQIVTHEMYTEAKSFEAVITEINKFKLLDLSFLNISISKLEGIEPESLNEIKYFNLSSTTFDYNPIGKCSEDIPKFFIFLERLSSLEELDLSNCCLGSLDSTNLGKLGDILGNLNLKRIDLSGNNIDDYTLSGLFRFDVKSNLLSDGKKFKTLEHINLSNNFIKFSDYHNDGPCHQYQKAFLDELFNSSIKVDLSCNYIRFIDKKDGFYKTSAIFAEFTNLSGKCTKIQSLLNPAYFIDENKGLVVIANYKEKEHAQILIHEINKEDGQLTLMRCHFTNEGHDLGEFEVRLKEFLDDRCTKFTFGKFLLKDKDAIDKMKANIKKDQREQQLSMLHFSCDKDATNCYRYCLNLVQKNLDSNLSQPFVAIPGFGLNNIILPTPTHFAFSFFDKFNFNRSTKVNTSQVDLARKVDSENASTSNNAGKKANNNAVKSEPNSSVLHQYQWRNYIGNARTIFNVGTKVNNNAVEIELNSPVVHEWRNDLKKANASFETGKMAYENAIHEQNPLKKNVCYKDAKMYFLKAQQKYQRVRDHSDDNEVKEMAIKQLAKLEDGDRHYLSKIETMLQP
jgi:hypothetical protein